MFYDPDKVPEEMIRDIIFDAEDVFAEELGTPDSEGGPLTSDMILIRPIRHHPSTTSKHALEFVVSIHHYPARMKDPDGLAKKIGERLSGAIHMILDPTLMSPLPGMPWDCFVQLELSEIGYEPFKI